jgi:uncharacterized protein DUF4190
MKRCPKCQQTYSDDLQNFCLNDGEYLVDAQLEPPPTIIGGQSPGSLSDDSTPTVLLNQPRVTNQTSWEAGGPMSPWQGQPSPVQQSYQPPVPFHPYRGVQSPNQTLAVVSLCLGVGSITVGWCCSMGLLLSPAAMITGFIALSQIKKDPRAHGGKGLAIGGIATGSVFLALYVVFIIIYGLASFLPYILK